MKKLLSLVLALTMVAGLLAGCGSKEPVETTTPKASVEGTMEELLNKVIEIQPVEFMGSTMALDLTKTDEESLWQIKSFTGLEDASQIVEAAAYEPMIGSIAFSMVMVRVVPGADAKAVAESMKAGVDPRKWVCVGADQMKVAGYSDVVMLIMLDSATELDAQSFVDAFTQVVGGTADFVLE